LLLLVASAGFAAESQLEGAARCSKVLGERERLVCFDRVFPVGTQVSELPAARTASPSTAVAPAVAATSPAPVPASAPAASSGFADESLKARNKPDKERAAEVNNMTAQISDLKETRANVWRISLDNGQVWQQQDMNNGFLPKAGGTIRIERGMMGGYSMALIGESRSPWVRVTRLK
jgi:hypothetical protein